MRKKILRMLTAVFILSSLFLFAGLPVKAAADERFETTQDGAIRPSEVQFYKGYYYVLFKNEGTIVRYKENGKKYSIVYSALGRKDLGQLSAYQTGVLTDFYDSFLIYNDKIYINMVKNHTKDVGQYPVIIRLNLRAGKASGKPVEIAYQNGIDGGGKGSSQIQQRWGTSPFSNWCIWNNRLHYDYSGSWDHCSCDLDGKNEASIDFQGYFYNGYIYAYGSETEGNKEVLYKMNETTGEKVSYKTLNFGARVKYVDSNRVFIQKNNTNMYWTVANEGNQTGTYLGNGLENLIPYKGNLYFYQESTTEKRTKGYIYKSKGYGTVSSSAIKISPNNQPISSAYSCFGTIIYPAKNGIILNSNIDQCILFPANGKQKGYSLIKSDHDTRNSSLGLVEYIIKPTFRAFHPEYTFLKPKHTGISTAALKRVNTYTKQKNGHYLPSNQNILYNIFGMRELDLTQKVTKQIACGLLIETVRSMEDKHVNFTASIRLPRGPLDDIPSNYYKDVNSSLNYIAHLSTLYYIAKRDRTRNFNLNELVTKEDAAIYIVRMIKSFNSVSRKQYRVSMKTKSIRKVKDYNKVRSSARESIAILYNLGIMKPNKKGKMNPKSKITREQMIVYCDQIIRAFKAKS